MVKYAVTSRVEDVLLMRVKFAITGAVNVSRIVVGASVGNKVGGSVGAFV